MPQVARFWNQIAQDFDAIYSGNKGPLGRALDHWLRKDIYQRFDWVMDRCGDVRVIHTAALIDDQLKLARNLAAQQSVEAHCDWVHADVIDWRPTQTYDITIAIGFWDYIAEPPGRLQKIRKFTTDRFLSAWPRFWTWRMPVRKVRLQYISGCPVYFFRKPEVYRILEQSGFRVERCDTVGKLFCVEARST